MSFDLLFMSVNRTGKERYVLVPILRGMNVI